MHSILFLLKGGFVSTYKKLAGKHYRVENGIEVEYKIGSVIEATAEELKKHDPALATWQLIKETKEDEKPKIPEVSLKAVPIEGTKLFNVLNEATKENINDVPLTRRAAFSLIKEYTEEEATE